MASIMQILRRIGGAKMPPTSGSAGQLALWKAGTAPTDAASLYAHDGTQWAELLDTSAQWTVSGADVHRAAGKVGIGIAVPTTDLEVHGAAAIIKASGANPAIVASGSTTGTFQAAAGARFVNLQINATSTSLAPSAGPMHLSASQLDFQIASKTWIRIQPSGNVIINDTGIGVSETGNDVGATHYAGGIFGVHAANDRVMFVRRSGSDGVLVNFVKDKVSRGAISISGSTTTYATSSDYRLKEDFRPIADPAKQLAALKPVNFAWRLDGTRTDGFIAHEVAEVIPVAVTGEKDAVDADGNPIYQGIDQAKLVPVLVAALQDALKRIEALEARP